MINIAQCRDLTISIDIYRTEADVSDLQNDLDYKPNTSVYEGIKRFVDWYLAYSG